MKTDTRIIILGTLFILLFGVFSSLAVKNKKPTTLTQDSYGSWSCTADVYTCADGTEVGRTPPYCHFASCPSTP